MDPGEHVGRSGREESRPVRRLPWLRSRMGLPSYFLLAVALATLPGRVGTALYEAQFGVSPWAYLTVGLLVDFRDHLLAFAVTNLLVAGVLRVLVWRRKTFVEVLQITVPVWTSLLFAFAMLCSVSAAEFRIERGIYPTTFDVETGVADTGFVTGVLGLFGLERFLVPTLACVVAFVAWTFQVPRIIRQASPLGSWRELAILIGGLGALTASCFGLHRAAPHVFRSIPHWRVVGSPPVIFIESGAIHENIRLGALSLFRKIELPQELQEPGAAMFGFPPKTVRDLDRPRSGDQCQPHPLATPIYLADESEASPAPDELQLALRRLSQALFRDRELPLRIWQVSLESFRGDDIHALNDPAPRGIAPVANQLYENAAGLRPSVIASKNHYGAGTRTSQGLSAMLCGLGTLPFGFAFGRDLGKLPFRCLPDVLVDASFSAAFYYGSSPDFDNMRVFFNYHGIDHLITKMDFRKEIWSQDWNAPDHASDRAVFARAVADAAQRPADVPQYNLLMTLTNHFPFALPPDAPSDLVARVGRVIEESGRSISRDDTSRLQTFFYMDDAFGEFLDAVANSAAGSQSIVVAVADHATPDRNLWQDWNAAPVDQRRVPVTRVPLFIVLPEPLLDASVDPDEARAAIREVNRALSAAPTSQNDIPRMLLELLSHYRRMRTIPAAWRWHTLGSQRLSPFFRVASYPSAAVLGIDASSRVFLVDREDRLLPVEEVARPTLVPGEVAESSPVLLPGAAFLASFVQTYAVNCWGREHIRNAR